MKEKEDLKLAQELSSALSGEYFKFLDSNYSHLKGSISLRILLSGVQDFYFTNLYVLTKSMENTDIAEKNEFIDKLEIAHLSMTKNLRKKINGEENGQKGNDQ